jgi:hypothetical protein
MKPWGIQCKNRLETLASSQWDPPKTGKNHAILLELSPHLAQPRLGSSPHLTLQFFSPRQIVAEAYILLFWEDIILLYLAKGHQKYALVN